MAQLARVLGSWMPSHVPNARCLLGACLFQPTSTQDAPATHLIAAGSGTPLAKLEWTPTLTWQRVLDRATQLVSTECTWKVRIFLGHGGAEILDWDTKVPHDLRVPIIVLNMSNQRLPELRLRCQKEPEYLAKCAKTGDAEMVRLLLAAKADVNHRNNDGYTALSWAAWNFDFEIFQLLQEAVQ